MEMYDVAKKLLGQIEPVGETYEDERRLENLEATIELVDKLLFDISSVSFRRDSQLASVKEAGKRAHRFLIELQEEIITE